MTVINFKQLGYSYGGPLELKDNSVDTSKLTSNQMLVRVAAASLNPADVQLYNTHTTFQYFWRRQLTGFGLDFSGVVEAVGSAVTKFSIGDKVSGLYQDGSAMAAMKETGTFSEYLVIDVSKNLNVGVIPKNLSMEEAAAFPLVYGTAVATLSYFKHPKECDSFLINGGATSVGAIVIQLLKKVHGVKTVVSVNSGSSAERVKRYGADYIVDYTKDDIKAELLSIVQEKGKFDVIIDCVGGTLFSPYMDDILKSKKETKSGLVSLCGAHILDYKATIIQNNVNWANFKFFFFPKSWSVAFCVIKTEPWYESAVGLFEQGTLEVPIDSVHPFEKFQDAIDTMIGHKAKGKVVVKIEYIST